MPPLGVTSKVLKAVPVLKEESQMCRQATELDAKVTDREMGGKKSKQMTSEKQRISACIQFLNIEIVFSGETWYSISALVRY